MENRARSSPLPPAELPPPEELLKKIHELELGHAQMKQEMSRLLSSSSAAPAGNYNRKERSDSISPQKRRDGGAGGGGGGGEGGKMLAAFKRGSASFRRSSPLRREGSGCSSIDDGGGGGEEPAAMKLTDKQYLEIMDSIGQAVHVMDNSARLVYWNRSAEHLYGFTAEEALGRDVFELLVDPLFISVGNDILARVSRGENWTGQFPVRNKWGDRFSIIATDTGLFDDAGVFVGVICVASDSRPFKGPKLIAAQAAATSEADSRGSMARASAPRRFGSSKLGVDHQQQQQPLQVAIASKISIFASKVSNKVKAKMRPVENVDRDDSGWDGSYSNNQVYPDAVVPEHQDDAASSGGSTPRGDIQRPTFAMFSGINPERNSPGRPTQDPGDEREGKPGISKILSSKAESWVGKTGLTWPWKGNERDRERERERDREHDGEPKPSRFVWPWSQNDQENEQGQRIDNETIKSETLVSAESNTAAHIEASGSWSSSANVNSTSSSSSYGSISSGAINKVESDIDSLDYEISWEDLTVGEQIGQGSCGIVYHGLWFGSDVAVKVFPKQEYSDDVLLPFRQEVALMKRLRHPNILLFMGAVTSPQRLCIVTEFLPRGSLFRFLQRNPSKLEKRRQIHMALDIARGMSYLHHFNPPIIHRDLKSSNLLVDKNWTVKVGDFGLSRLKLETYLQTKTGKGTPQWMAPEVLRNEPSDEKADVYSYGVVLWELATQKIPWDNLNSMQVIGAVGFMHQQLETPEDVDPQWAALIESCCHSEPKMRPSFQELVEKLKDMYKKYAMQLQAGRVAGDAAAQKEL